MGRRRGEGTDLELASAVLDGNSDLRKERDARPRGDHLRERRKARRAKLALLRSGSVADRERLRAEAMSLVEQEHVLVVQIAGGDALLPCKPVPFRERHDEGVVRDAARGPLADVCLEREQARVEPPFAQVGDDRVRLLLAKDELQLRLPGADGGHHVRQKIGRDRGDDADPERPRTWLDELLRGGDHVVDFEEHPTRVRDDDGAGRGEQDSPAIALEELNAEHVLELLHLRAERRLRNVATLRRLVEPERLGHRDYVLELTWREVMSTDSHVLSV
jgi:hypothetical protein